jgi:hypothetical protein
MSGNLTPLRGKGKAALASSLTTIYGRPMSRIRVLLASSAPITALGPLDYTLPDGMDAPPAVQGD